MEFLISALQAIPQAATSPYAFIAYLVAVLAWVAITYRVKRNETLLANIDKLPAEDRRLALEAEMGAAAVHGGISPEDWLKQKRQSYYFFGFLAILAVAVVIFVIAVSESNAARSRAELGAVLDDRATAFLGAISALIDDKPGVPPAIFDANAEAYDAPLRSDLTKLKTDAEGLIALQKKALADGSMVRFYEIGNQLNSLAKRIDPLIEKSTTRADELRDLVDMLSGMNPTEMANASTYYTQEISRNTQLRDLKSGTENLCQQVKPGVCY
ncbi:hypothetical protein [Rhizobium leguminosarum]|uniref:hypothetical protein n=1 Tax=Rhizobium leguminosarum TaxID=384 RepID=UPI0004A4335B|nr:hypothetical protein [Rhizobium leguminosarum]